MSRIQCDTILRTGECAMYEGHRGRHTTVAHYCDVCGEMRRGQGFPIRQRIAPDEWEWVATMCFLCSRDLTPARREADRFDREGV